MKKTRMLKKNYEFKNVLSKGKYYSGHYMEAFIKENGKSFNLLGLAISVKSAKAVKRNLIKRLIRENYRILEDFIKEGKSIVFLWKKSAKIQDISFKHIEEDMKFILKKASIFKENKERI